MKSKLLLVITGLLLLGCTLRIVDDTSDYEITAKVQSDDCNVEINRVEGKTTGTKNAKVTR